MALHNKVQALVAEYLNTPIVELDFSHLEFEVEIEQLTAGYYADSRINASIGGYVTNVSTEQIHHVYIDDVYSKLHVEIEEALNAAVRIS